MPFEQHKQPLYHRYTRAYDTADYSRIDPDEAAAHVQQFMQQAPAEMQHEVYGPCFSHCTPQQRQQMAQRLPLATATATATATDTVDPDQIAAYLVHLAQCRPDLTPQLFAPGGALHPRVCTDVVRELAAGAAKEVLQQRTRATIF